MKDPEEVYVILKEARFARKGDYRTYKSFKNKIEELNLPWEEYDNAIRQLSKILKI